MCRNLRGSRALSPSVRCCSPISRECPRIVRNLLTQHRAPCQTPSQVFSPLHFANPRMKLNRRETFKVGHNREELGAGSHPVEITRHWTRQGRNKDVKQTLGGPPSNGELPSAEAGLPQVVHAAPGLHHLRYVL